MAVKQRMRTDTSNWAGLRDEQNGRQVGQVGAVRQSGRGRRWRRRLLAIAIALLLVGAGVFWWGTGRIVSGALYVAQRQLAADSIFLAWERILWLPPYTLIIRGIHMHRDSAFDVFVDRVALRIRWQSIWKGIFRVHSLTVQDVEGMVWLFPIASDTVDSAPDTPSSALAEPVDLPPVQLDRLILRDVSLTVMLTREDTLSRLAGFQMGIYRVCTGGSSLTIDSLTLRARQLHVWSFADTTETPPSDTLWAWSWLAVLPSGMHVGIARIRVIVDTFSFTQVDSSGLVYGEDSVWVRRAPSTLSYSGRTSMEVSQLRAILDEIAFSADSFTVTRVSLEAAKPALSVSGALSADIVRQTLAVPQLIVHTPAWTMHYAGWLNTRQPIVRTTDPLAHIEGWHALHIETDAGDSLWHWLSQWANFLGQDLDSLLYGVATLPASKLNLAVHTWGGTLAIAWHLTLRSGEGKPVLDNQNFVVAQWESHISVDSLMRGGVLPVAGRVHGALFIAPGLQRFWQAWVTQPLDSVWQGWWTAFTPAYWSWHGGIHNQTLTLWHRLWLGTAHFQFHTRYIHGMHPEVVAQWTGSAIGLPSPVQTRVDSLTGTLTLTLNQDYTLQESQAELVAHHVSSPYLRDSVNFRLVGELHSSIWHLSLWLYGRDVFQQLIFTMHGTQEAFFVRGQGQGSITCQASMPHGWNALPIPVHLHPLETHFRFQWREDAFSLTWDLAESQVRLDTVMQSLAGTMGGIRWTAPDSLSLWLAGSGMDASFQAAHLTALTAFLEENPLWGFFPAQPLPSGQIAFHLNLESVPDVLIAQLFPDLRVEAPVKIRLNVADSIVQAQARLQELCYAPGEICASNLMLESQIAPGRTHWQALIHQITLPALDTLMNWHVRWRGDSLLGTLHLKTHFAHTTQPFVLQFAVYRSGTFWRMGIDSMVFPYGEEQWYAVPAYCMAGPGAVCIPDLFLTNTEGTASLRFALQPDGYYALHVDRFHLTPLLRTFVAPYVGMDLAGRLSGHIRVDTLLQKVAVDSIVLRAVRLDTMLLPVWRLAGAYDLKRQTGTVQLIQQDANRHQGVLMGRVTPNQVVLTMDSFGIHWLQPFLTGILDSFAGFLTTEQPIVIHLASGGEAINDLNGTIQIQGLHFHVDFTGVTYSATGKGILTGDSLQLRLVLTDPAGRLARAQGAVHFQPFTYSVSITTRDVLAMATTAEQNPDYYGVARIGGTVRLYGDLSTFWIALEEVTPIRPSELTMPIYTGPYVSEEDWIRFRPRSTPANQNVQSAGKRQSTQDQSASSTEQQASTGADTDEGEAFGVGFRATIHLSDALTLVIPFDPPTGDVLQVAGTGNIELEYLPDGRFAMRGIYQIQSGSYRFNYSGLIVKEFQIAEGTIRWTGSPYDGLLDLIAEYRQKTTTSNLALYQQQQSGGQASELPRYVTAIVRMHMQGTLAQPTLAFELDIVEAERDPRLATIVRAINANPQERDYQVFSLLAINQFAPPRYAGGGVVAGASNVYQTMSHFMSQQLTSLAQELLGDESLQLTVGYQKGKEATGQKAVAVEVGISKALFGQRMVIDIGGTMVRAHEGSQLSGTMQLEYLLTKDGRWRWRLFSQMQEGAAGQKVYYTGMGLRYVRHFEKLFRTKQKKKQASQNEKANRNTLQNRPIREEEEQENP